MSVSTDLTTLASLKAWLGITASTDDTALTALVTAASLDFLQRCNRATLLTASYSERYDGQGGGILPLLNFPVTAVSLVQAGNIVIPQSPDYISAGWVFDSISVKLVGSAYEFCRGFQNILVEYTAGYSSAPPEVAQAVNVMCSAWWKRRQWTDQVSKNLGGEVIQFRREDIPPEAKRVVLQYTRRIPA